MMPKKVVLSGPHTSYIQIVIDYNELYRMKKKSETEMNNISDCYYCFIVLLLLLFYCFIILQYYVTFLFHIVTFYFNRHLLSF